MMELPNSPTARTPAMTVRTFRMRPFMMTSHGMRGEVTMPRRRSRPEEAPSRANREILPGSPRVTVEPPHRRLAHPGQVVDLVLRQGRPAGRPRLCTLHSTVEPAWVRVRQAGEARQP